MKKFLVSLLLLAGASALFFSGCNLPQPTPSPTAGLPICDTANLQAVIQTGPDDGAVVNTLTPVLTWQYPDPNCTPEGYRIDLYTGPFFNDDLGGGTGNPSTSWTPASPLQPATEYGWKVRPINGTTLGPVAGWHYFFTGPMCDDPHALVAPVLLAPANGAIYDDLRDAGLIWDYPEDCLPEGYRIDVSPDPDFNDTSLSGGTGSPSTRWGVGRPLTPCQTYYWRVAAVIGSTLGPYSDTRTFIAAPAPGNACSTPEPLPATIRGTVWHDLCAETEGPMPTPLPTGCVQGTDGSTHADGIHQPNEPGIGGVQVTLHPMGDCNAPAVATTTTNANGDYVFDDITDFGTYCVRIAAGEAPNDAILIPGEWAYPASAYGHDPATQTASVAASDTITLDFGWDYQFLPAPPTPRVPLFRLDKNAFCRQGPGKNYPKVATLASGDTVPIQGRLANNAWFYIFVEKSNTHCWIASTVGQAEGNTGQTAVMTPPPPPTPADTTPPEITDVHPLGKLVYYNSKKCGSTVLEVAARVTDDIGVRENNIVMQYRYVPTGGAPSGWHSTPVHDRAMGNQYGFMVDVVNEAKGAMQATSGHIEYRIVAIDNAGNKAVSHTLSMLLDFCK